MNRVPLAVVPVNPDHDVTDFLKLDVCVCVLGQPAREQSGGRDDGRQKNKGSTIPTLPVNGGHAEGVAGIEDLLHIVVGNVATLLPTFFPFCCNNVGGYAVAVERRLAQPQLIERFHQPMIGP